MLLISRINTVNGGVGWSYALDKPSTISLTSWAIAMHYESIIDEHIVMFAFGDPTVSLYICVLGIFGGSLPTTVD